MMTTPEKLFYHRLITEWKYNIGVWKTVIDWTVALYMVIPFLAFAGYQYLEWWKVTPPWLELVPFSLFAATSLIFAWSGTVRVFFQEADQLFLWNRHKWLDTMIRRGIIYSICLNLTTSVLFFLLLAPLLIGHYQMSINELISFGLITFLVKIVLNLLKQLLTLIFQGVKQWIILKGMLILFGFLFVTCIPNILSNSTLYIPCILILLLIIPILINKRMNITGCFLLDIEREYRERLKYVTFLLKVSGTNFKNPQKPKKRPLLFRNSNIIFNKRTAVNGLVEFGIKSTLRSKQRMQQYITFVSICLLAVLGFSTYKWLIWFILSFILTNFVNVDWKESMRSDFIKVFQWKKEDKYLATRKFLFLMSLPGLMVVSFAIGYQTFSWIEAIAFLPLSVGVAFLMSKIVSLYSSF